jgi:hypothetical protein
MDTERDNVTQFGTASSARDVVRTIAMSRAAIGVSLLLAPRLAGKLFVGGLVDQPGGQFISRAIGVREVALASGLLVAMERDRPVRGWVEAAVLVDAVDSFVAVFRGRGLPALGRFLFAAGGAAFAIAGASSAPNVDRDVAEAA